MNPDRIIARYRPFSRANVELLLAATPRKIPTSADGINRTTTGFMIAPARRCAAAAGAAINKLQIIAAACNSCCIEPLYPCAV